MSTTTGLAVRRKISATDEYSARITLSCSRFACLLQLSSLFASSTILAMWTFPIGLMVKTEGFAMPLSVSTSCGATDISLGRGRGGVERVNLL